MQTLLNVNRQIPVKAILVDIDVILDVLAKREPFFASSARLWAEIEGGHAKAYLASHSVTTIFYLVAKARGKEFARSCISDLLSVFRIAPVKESTLRLALEAKITDFEDAVQFAAAKEVAAEFIISRNIGHYKKSEIPATTPELFLATLKFSG
jgi:predicted nucleic acid-binding protein